MLDVKRMQALRAVVTSGSVTSAATNLGYTPSAVSQQITALEKQVGVPLLERVGRGVQPTAAGRLLTEHASIIGSRVAEAETALADLRDGRTGRIAVRYFATAGAALVPPALAKLRKEHPGVQVDLKVTDPADPLADVKQGRADLALVVRPRERVRQSIRLIHLVDDPYVVVLPKQHPLATRKRNAGAIDLGELADEPWVSNEWPVGLCMETTLESCAAAGFSPDFVVESEDYATAQGFVAAGLGVSVMPRMGVGHKHPGVAVKPLRRPEPVRGIYAAVRETSLAQPALRGLLDALGTAARSR